MEDRAFWEERERRFRSLIDPTRLADALYHELEDITTVIEHMGAALLAILPTALNHDQVDASIPLEVIKDRAWRLASAGLVQQRMRDGEYFRRWSLTIERPGAASDAVSKDLLKRFEAEAIVAGRAAGLVAQDDRPDAAIDAWLAHLWDGPFPANGSFVRVDNFIAASATLCARLAAEAYQPRQANSINEGRPTQASMKAGPPTRTDSPAPPIDGSKALTVAQAARSLQVSEDTIGRMRDRGEIQMFKAGSRWRVLASEIARLRQTPKFTHRNR